MKTSLWILVSGILALGCNGQLSSRQLAQAVTQFSQNLYQKIGLANKNLVYSPYSVHSAMTMTLAGARGDTASEMTTALQLTSILDPHAAYKGLTQMLTQTQETAVEVANGLFLNPNLPVKPAFIQEVALNYGAKVDNFNLAAAGGPEKSVNDFVADATNDVIKSILPANTINMDTLAVLINTLFFNGTWEYPFAEHKTKKQDFHKGDGTVTQVDMMTLGEPTTLNVGHDTSKGLDILELPFKGRRFSLFIAMPKTQDIMNKIEMSAGHLLSVTSMLDGFVPTDSVQVKLPKFKIETETDLMVPLRNMGIMRAFDHLRADFSGITNSPAHISKVLHKAVIDVQESGTVASAATAVVISRETIVITNEVFTVDRPFFFFLKDKTSDLILFQGKFTGN